jgi:hypothetical protein
MREDARVFCPHCGIKTRQQLIHSQSYTYELKERLSETTENINGTYLIAVCLNCEQVLLYHANNDNDIPNLNQFYDAKLQWPDSGTLHWSIPEKIVGYYKEALKVKIYSPNAFANQIGRALEAVCNDKGATGRELYKKLTNLAQKGILPSLLAEMANEIRLLRNLGSHDAERPVESWQVPFIDDFFRAVVEYLYVYPSKLKEHRETFRELIQKQV